MRRAGLTGLLELPGLFPPGFAYRPDFIDRDEERTLVEAIATLTFSEVRMHGVVARRRIVQYGWRYSFSSFALTEAPPVPVFLEPFRRRISALVGIPAEEFSEALITEYRPGATIGWHRDRPVFGVVAGLSLMSACRFRLRHPGSSERPIALQLAPRSLYVLAGEARREWQHSIPATPDLRYSVTFRTRRKRAMAARSFR